MFYKGQYTFAAKLKRDNNWVQGLQMFLEQTCQFKICPKESREEQLQTAT
uniref:Uncharacterized protein n=1 Tax=Anguilla anguilla TaxID=7936 RepID=A0A0E9R8X7_ANGAN